MKTLHLSIIIGISFLSFVFLMIHVNSYAYTCAVQAPSVTTQYYYLHSDSVFVGTVSSITNYTNHQLNVKFDVEKSWKGSQHPTITTYSLVACGYSLVKGEKYLIFAAGYPLDYFEWATKPFDNAKDEIVLLDSQQFQAQANADEVLYKRLVNARDAISNMMGSKMSQIPISSVGVNDLNFTLDIGIADKKAATPSGVEEYKQKLEEIVGNVPIRVLYSEYATALPEIITQHTVLPSPLMQFKSGISALDVKCTSNYALVIKAEDGSPACVRPFTVKVLSEKGWSKFESTQSNHNANAKTNPFGIVGLMYYHGGGPCGVGTCPLNTFNLKMNSNYTTYLLGYNICNDNSCIVRNDLSALLPLNVIGIPNYKFIALPENPQWKHDDVFHIQVKVSSIPDNTTAVWTDLGNSTIIH